MQQWRTVTLDNSLYTASMHKSIDSSTKTALQVLVADPYQKPRYEEVFMFSHRDPKALTSFVHIRTTTNTELRASPGHYIWSAPHVHASGRLVKAVKLQIGDYVWTGAGQTSGAYARTGLAPSRIVAIRSELGRGLYNPHTASGSIMVDDIATATFTDVLPASTVVHSIVTLPARMLSSLLYAQSLREKVNDLLLAGVFGSPHTLAAGLGAAASQG